ncbi:SDR family NAD(P)-dependent oxidoreductase [Enemella dayhoffiae]|uniref:SDR family NAD(P)-dependent oxidoreductase n=1 Tax=Enemella dayhoffiae TaxID=2016507 RepID=UPI001E5D934D|nr:SDR family NAD(P)-dependent oxidoreductase [Enemella dayhoffiae]
MSSDAAVEHYEGWGAYAASKAALDHLAGTWAAEEAGIRAYAVDPGDMRTAMHQAAFPGRTSPTVPAPTRSPSRESLPCWIPVRPAAAIALRTSRPP